MNSPLLGATAQKAGDAHDLVPSEGLGGMKAGGCPDPLFHSMGREGIMHPRGGVGSPLWQSAKLWPQPPLYCGEESQGVLYFCQHRFNWPQSAKGNLDRVQGRPAPSEEASSAPHLQLAVSHQARPIETSIFAQGRLQPASLLLHFLKSCC